ncbi:MAG: putative glycosyl transferase, group 1 family protein [Herminiimonas sp.]|nr:putative glycosyl transferase, group 1 family protein [Herminiimonas sp.]
MRVLNVNSSLDLKSGGGTAERTFQMSRFLAMQGVDCTVLTIGYGLEQERLAELAPATVEEFRPLWRRFHMPRIKWASLRKLVDDPDIVHLMGHWGVLNALVYLVVRIRRKPYVVCPAGALPIFGRSRYLKRLYNAFIGNAIIRNASGWIAVTASEIPHFETYGVSSANITIIPNGVVENDLPSGAVERTRAKFGLPNASLILFMGRLNPIKGPDMLLNAFQSIAGDFPTCHLVFAGPDGGMLSELRRAAGDRGLSHRVHFLGHVDGRDKTALYHMADLLVVPSRQEAMSIVALEAGICGTLALITDQCGFSEIAGIDPRLEVPATAAGIAIGLRLLLSDKASMAALEPIWQQFVRNGFSWDRLIHRYIALYCGLLSGNANS